LAEHGQRGMFVPSVKHIHCRFDDTDALALLNLIAAERGCPDMVPGFRSQGGYIHGDIQLADGSKRNVIDIKDIYPLTMG
jgi:pectate lyase